MSEADFEKAFPKPKHTTTVNGEQQYYHRIRSWEAMEFGWLSALKWVDENFCINPQEDYDVLLKEIEALERK